MTTMTREEAIRAYVEQLSGSELADLIQYMTSYDMDLFDEFMSNYTPSEIAQMMWFGNFNPNKDYW